MDDIMKIYNHYNLLDYNQKIIIAKESYKKIIDILNKYNYGNFFTDASMIASWYLTVFVNNDRNDISLELSFYNEIIKKKVSLNYFLKECQENKSPEIINTLKEFLKNMSKDEKNHFLILAVLMSTLRGKLNEEDEKFIFSFFN